MKLLYQGCDLNVRICARHCVFSGKRRFRCGEKLACVRDGCGRRRFAVQSCSICARSGTECSRSLFLFFVDAVLLLFAIESVQIAVEWLRQGCLKDSYSSVASCKSDCVLHVIVGRSHWSCYIKDAIWMLGFARNIVYFRVNGGSLRRKVGLRARRLRASPLCRRFLFDLRAQWNWGFQVTFSLLCWCCAFMFCNWVCADRSGMAVPRLLEG